MYQYLERIFPGQEEIVVALAGYAQKLLAQSSGGLIAGVAMVILFYSVYSMLNHIEEALNTIWQVQSPRSIGQRINHYLSLILAGPMILILAGSLKVYISRELGIDQLYLAFVGNLTSLALVVLFFAWLFAQVPNTAVSSKAAFLSAMQTGIAYFLVQSVLIESQILVSNYSAIYGSLAAFPIFLIWIQTSWVIVLFGAQFCFVYQNKLNHTWQIDINNLSFAARQNLSLRLVWVCIDQFKNYQTPTTIAQLAAAVHLPPSCVMQLLYKLVAAKVLIETNNLTHVANGYLPARSIEILNESTIIQSLNEHGINEVYTPKQI